MHLELAGLKASTKYESVEAAVCHVFIYEKQFWSFATTAKKSNEIPVMNITYQLHFVYEIRLCPVGLENC